MSLKGKWRIVEMEAWDKDFLDMVKPAYILFGETESEFALGCVTGSFGAVGDSNSIAFDWGGSDETDEAHGDRWAELQADGSLTGDGRSCAAPPLIEHRRRGLVGNSLARPSRCGADVYEPTVRE